MCVCRISHKISSVLKINFRTRWGWGGVIYVDMSVRRDGNGMI